jgi:tripartite-type tricarboxylate transporter receptor subunit TctC
VSSGSGLDGIARAAQNAMAGALGQSIVVENLPGASGVVGTQAMIRAAPDGLTLAMVSNNHVIYPSVLKSLPFDPLADITPIAVIGATPLLLVVHPALAASNLKELVALFRTHPGKYNYASSGNGTILHLASEMFKEITQTFVTHIPYRSAAAMVQDLITGQVDMAVMALPAALPYLKAGTLRAICAAAPSRSSAAPEVQTSKEQGYPAYLVEGWFAMVGPKNLPAAQVSRINAALLAAFSSQEVRDAMARQGNNINVSTPEFAQSHFRSELARYAALVKRSGMVDQ